MHAFAFMRFANAFIQSDSAFIYTYFYQYVCSLGIEAMSYRNMPAYAIGKLTTLKLESLITLHDLSSHHTFNLYNSA